jgi:hypothetical protein
VEAIRPRKHRRPAVTGAVRVHRGTLTRALSVRYCRLSTARSSLEKWAFASFQTPRAEPMPYSAYQEFIYGLRLVLQGRRVKSLRLHIRGYERGARSTSQKVSIRSLINLCAVQGISMSEFLHAPCEASSALRVDDWAGMPTWA